MAHVGLARAVAVAAQALGVGAVEPSSSIACATRRSGGPSRRTCSASGLRRAGSRAPARPRTTAPPGGVLADERLGLAPVVLARQHAGLDHRAGQLRQQRERGGQPPDRVAERLVVGERVVERDGEPLGDPRRDRAVEELDAEALGQRGADLAPAGAVGGGDGDERRRVGSLAG